MKELDQNRNTVVLKALDIYGASCVLRGSHIRIKACKITCSKSGQQDVMSH